MKSIAILLSITGLVTLSGALMAQQQLPNAGFEAWEEIRSDVWEPVSWNSIKNTDGSMAMKKLAPDVISKSEVAHSGRYSIRLVNKSTLGIVANGMLTNGAIHGSKDKTKSWVYTNPEIAGFFTPFKARPDSITGWYRYTPQGNDSALVVLLLHRGSATLPDHGTRGHWVGGLKLLLPATPKGVWTRFSAPVTYFKKEGAPEYILFVLSAGNRRNAVEGSEALFDDLVLVYN